MPPMQVWVGNEPDLQVMAALGSVGAVSGIANIAPRLVARLVKTTVQLLHRKTCNALRLCCKFWVVTRSRPLSRASWHSAPATQAGAACGHRFRPLQRPTTHSLPSK